MQFSFILTISRQGNCWTYQNSSSWTAAGVLGTVAAEEVTHGKLLSGPRNTEWPPVRATGDILRRYAVASTSTRSLLMLVSARAKRA